MGQFLIQTSICWLIFYVLYHILFKKFTFFEYNRWYLLSALIVGALIPALAPFLEVEKPNSVDLTLLASLLEFSETDSDAAYDYTRLFSIIAWSVYYAGVALFLSKMAFGLFTIYRLYSTNHKVKRANLILVDTKSEMLPFSFFNVIFLGKSFDEKALKKVIDHEAVHIHQNHTLDILFTELIKCFFWFNPIITYYKKSLKQAHEYIADYYVTQGTYNREYVHLLLNTSMSSLQSELTNQFFNSEIKNRIEMMTRNKTRRSKVLNYLLFLPALLTLTFVFAKNIQPELSSLEKEFNQLVEVPIFTTDTLPKQPSNIVEKEPLKPISITKEIEPLTEEFFITSDEMPLWIGSEGESYKELDLSSKTKLIEYAYRNVKYPEAAVKMGKEGQVVVQFVVDKKGFVRNISLLRDPDPDLSQATIDMINKMNTDGPKWLPGKQNGKVVNVQYTLPLKFKLSSNSDSTSSKMVEKQATLLPNPLLFNGACKPMQTVVLTEEEMSKVEAVNKPTIAERSKGLNEIPVSIIGDQNESTNVSNKKVTKNYIEKNPPFIVINGIKCGYGLEKGILDKIDPADIKAIAVLKNTNAIEKYGIEGTNGVIEVTLKEGKKVKMLEKITQASINKEATIDTVESYDINTKVFERHIVKSEAPEPKFFIDGKECSKEKAMKLDPKKLESVNVVESDVFMRTKSKKVEQKITFNGSNPIENGQLSLNIASLDKEITKFSFFDSKGALIRSIDKNLKTHTSSTIEFDINDFPKGAFILVVKQQNFNHGFRLINP